MANPQPIVIRSFAGGELAPTLAARADLAKYQIGLRKCLNWIVQRHGGVANRPGFKLINECKTTSADVRLFRYVSEDPDESVLLEFGESYIRFYLQGALITLSGVSAYNGATQYEIGDIVSSGGVNYYCRKKPPAPGTAPPNATYWYAMPSDILEVPHPFNAPFQVHYVQSGRVITFTHPNHAPHDLVFSSLTRWAMVPLVTTPQVTPPQNLVLTVAAGARKFGYVVTAAAPNSYEESEASSQVINAAAAAPTDAAPHVLTWDPVLVPLLTGDACPEYYVYCDPYGNGTYGFIGTATGAASFRNPGLTPDFSITPALPQDKFSTPGEYPSTCAYHQQRRYFGNTQNDPDAIFGSRVGFPDNFGISSPLQDDDAITFRIAGNNHHAVRRLVALKNLLVMTAGGEWRMVGAGGVITPNSIELDQETYVGISKDVAPAVVGNSIIYVQARESKVHDLNFDQDVEGLAGRDLTVFASHLFDGYTMTSLDYALSPDSIVWVTRSDGTLLGLTYIREQDVWGWHRHQTSGGAFENVCVVPEPGEDGVYVIVQRHGRRYIERLATRSILNFNQQAFFVDSGLSYSGAPVSSVGGLSHLEGDEVDAVGDGQYLGRFTVAGGAVNLGASYSDIHVGLPITADIETLDLDNPGSGSLRSAQKRTQAVNILIDSSSRGFQAGPTVDRLKRYNPSQYDSSTASFSGQIEMSIDANWRKPGRIYIRQDQALPLTVLGIIPLVEIGG